jgi:predicted TIM-barrel fold metal-dependent hydrolase
MTFSHFDFNYIDVHCHFFPPQIFEAIWDFFERIDDKNRIQGWPIYYKSSTNELIKILKKKNVEYFTAYNYAHKENVAEYINDWTYKLAKRNRNIIPFGCVWPEDNNRVEYIRKAFEEYNFYGIKIQLLVQNFFLNDERMNKIYELLVDKGKWLAIHIGTAPYRNKFVGYKNFIKFLKKYSDMKIIVAHMGAFEYQKFLNLLDNYENLYLDTAMIYIPNNIFPERESKRPGPEKLLSYQGKILFGSDFPNIPYEYENSTRGLLRFDLPRKFYEAIFYNNAKKMFNLGSKS